MSETVLVVDDDAIASSALRHVLATRGLRVVERNSGPDALRWLESNVADLVILDVAMPGVSGLDVCRWIRAAETTPGHVPIVVLSGRDRFADRAEAQAAGVDVYLVKPMPASRLIEVVERLLGVRRRLAAAISGVARSAAS